jgi:hypothetical protein
MHERNQSQALSKLLIIYGMLESDVSPYQCALAFSSHNETRSQQHPCELLKRRARRQRFSGSDVVALELAI